MKQVVAIAIGGALGALGRFAMATLTGEWDPMRWPWGTLAVNLIGCLVIGAIAGSVFILSGPWWTRPLLVTGVLGGFTTFSAFALEAGLLLDAGRPGAAAAYVGATMVGGLVAVRLGARLAGALVGGPVAR